jgi:S-adenosylmethionine:tRNA ribosyltransferase-isomerase
MIATELDFELPAELTAREPAEARGLRRDQVRLLVSRGDQPPSQHLFEDLPQVLAPGDLLVVNNSATMPAALDARLDDEDGELGEHGARVVLHVSNELTDGSWLVELRRPVGGSTAPFTDTPARVGRRLRIAGGVVTVLRAYTSRLWVVSADVPGSLADHLARHGRPIRYDYTDRDWPLSTYQTVFATEPGSAEMPSAGRPFTGAVLAALAAHGVLVAPITLHTGVASPEASEPPYPERFAVPPTTARLVEHVRATGGRVIAIGTTVVRALESAVRDGRVEARAGWTDLVIGPERGVHAVDGLLTGFHEPRASHLRMLAAVGGEQMLRLGYATALRERYLWHEFGDVHLLLPWKGRGHVDVRQPGLIVSGQ